MILSTGISPNIRGGDDDTPLHDAVGNGHVEVVQCLLKYGASITATNEHEQTPLEFAMDREGEAKDALDSYDGKDEEEKQALVQECEGFSGIVQLLRTWNKMTQQVVKRDSYGQTILHRACKDSDKILLQECIAYGADVNATDNSGWTPLHDASISGSFECADILLSHGSNPNALSFSNESCLHDAVSNDFPSVVRLLLQYGADAKLTNDKGQSAFDLLPQQCSQEMVDLSNIPASKWKPFKPPLFRQKPVSSLLHGAMVSEPHKHSNSNPHRKQNKSKSGGDTTSDHVSVTSGAEDAPKVRGITVNPQDAPYPFAWGGLDPSRGPFESSREEKKFMALWQKIAQTEGGRRESPIASAASGNKSASVELKNTESSAKRNARVASAKKNPIKPQPATRKKLYKSGTSVTHSTSSSDSDQSSLSMEEDKKRSVDSLKSPRNRKGTKQKRVDVRKRLVSGETSLHSSSQSSDGDDEQEEESEKSIGKTSAGKQKKSKSAGRNDSDASSVDVKASTEIRSRGYKRKNIDDKPRRSTSPSKQGSGRKQATNESATKRRRLSDDESGNNVNNGGMSSDLGDDKLFGDETDEEVQIDDQDMTQSVTVESLEAQKPPLPIAAITRIDTSVSAIRSLGMAPSSSLISDGFSSAPTSGLPSDGKVSLLQAQPSRPKKKKKSWLGISGYQRAGEGGETNTNDESNDNSGSQPASAEKPDQPDAVSGQINVSNSTIGKEEDVVVVVASPSESTVGQKTESTGGHRRSITSNASETPKGTNSSPISQQVSNNSFEVISVTENIHNAPMFWRKAILTSRLHKDEERSNKVKQQYAKFCMPLYALEIAIPQPTYPIVKHVSTKKTIGKPVYLVDLQVAYFLGMPSGRALLTKYPQVTRRVATQTEKAVLERTVVSQTLLQAIMAATPQSVKWIRWIQTAKGSKCLKLSDIDIHLLDIDSAFEEIPIMEQFKTLFEGFELQFDMSCDMHMCISDQIVDVYGCRDR